MGLVIEIATTSLSRLFIPIFAGLLTIVGAYFSSEITEREVSKSSDKYPAFEAVMVQVLKNSDVLSLDKASLLFEAIHSSDEVVNHQVTLRNYLVRLNYQITLDRSKLEVEEARLTEFNTQIRKIISNLEEVSPYQGLAPIEASLFQDISALTDDDEVERKLRQLSSVFKVRFEELEQSKTEARWSLIFGIAGLVVGVVSVLLSVFPLTRQTKEKSET